MKVYLWASVGFMGLMSCFFLILTGFIQDILPGFGALLCSIFFIWGIIVIARLK